MSSTMDPAGRLGRLLDGAGVLHSLDPSPEGPRTARFGLHLPVGTSVTVSATLLESELRFTAQAVLGGPDTLRPPEWFTRVNESWRYGRVYPVPESGEIDAALAMYLGGRDPDTEHVHRVLAHLADSVAALRLGAVPTLQPLAAGPDPDLGRVVEMLAGIGLRSTFSGGRLFAGVREDGHNHVFAFSAPGGAALGVRAFLADPLEGPPPGGERLVHEINRSLSYGTLSLVEGIDPEYALIEPLAWTVLDDDLVSWIIGKGLYVLAHVRERLGN